MSDLGNPELPEPEKMPAGESAPPQEPVADPSMNGNGNGTPYAQGPAPGPQVDMTKLVEWMKHTDKQLVMLTLGQVGLAAAVLFILWKAKGEVVKAAKP